MRRLPDAMAADLYRMFDRNGVLLYVGISASAFIRMIQHRDTKDWWTDVARMDIEHLDTRRQAVLAEEQAIEREHPVHNVIHNGTVLQFGIRRGDVWVDRRISELAEVIAELPVDPSFCAQSYWCGPLMLHELLGYFVGDEAMFPEFRPEAIFDTAFEWLNDATPPCSHDGRCRDATVQERVALGEIVARVAPGVMSVCAGRVLNEPGVALLEWPQFNPAHPEHWQATHISVRLHAHHMLA